MEIWYNGKSRDEGLVSLIEAIKPDARLSELVRYAELRLKGLRKPAFKHLDTFIKSTKHRPVSEQREIVKRIMELEFAHRGKAFTISTPLNKKLIEPVLNDWMAHGPEGHIATRLNGLVNRDLASLKLAYKHDPKDCEVWSVLFREDVLERLYWATHHIHETALLFSIDEIDNLLQRGHSMVANAPVGDVTNLLEDFSFYIQLIADWKAFKASGQPDFPNWCEENGKEHAWSSTYYYE